MKFGARFDGRNDFRQRDAAFTLAGGQLYVLSGKQQVIVRLPSPKIVTETNAVSPDCCSASSLEHRGMRI